MKLKITRVLLAVTLLLSTASAAEVFTGVITDSMCLSDHRAMNVTPESKCVNDCVKYGAKYVLLVGKRVYPLNHQQTPAKFAGQKVTVTGIFDAKAKILKVESIKRAGL